jgi:two-component system, LytTR family, response regulator
MPLTVLLVDDEPLAREGLRLLLAGDPDIGAIEEARNGREAVAAIRKLHPDLVFLDIQMPEMDGLEVVREIGADRMPAVVFVTAHDQHAIQAFELNAIDYLLKPVGAERFQKTLVRAKSTLRVNPAAGHQILSLLESMAPARQYLKRLAVRAAAKTLLVEVADIDWIGAAENYVELHAGSARHLVHVSMNAIEQRLDPEVFLRIHRSLIVNVSRIRELEPMAHGEYVVTLTSGARLQSSRAYSEKLRALATNPF